MCVLNLQYILRIKLELSFSYFSFPLSPVTVIYNCDINVASILAMDEHR